MKEEMFELKLKGYCCSQIVMEMGLTRLQKKNEDLIAAMAGLCDGVHSGGTCGILSAGICLLYLADSKAAVQGLAEDFTDWFEDAFGEIQCSSLIGENLLSKVEKCPAMLESAFEKIEELLEWD